MTDSLKENIDDIFPILISLLQITKKNNKEVNVIRAKFM